MEQVINNTNEIAEFEAQVCKHPDYEVAMHSVYHMLTRSRRIPKSLAILGAPGTGKTFIAEQVTKSLTATDTPELTTRPYIYINVALCKTPGQLLTEMLFELGDIAPSKKDDEVVKLRRIQTLLTKCHTKLIIIDEIQDLFPKKGLDKRSAVYKSLKNIKSKLSVPFLYLGTQEAEMMFRVDEQLRDRFWPTHYMGQFNCCTTDDAISFALVIESLLEKYPRKVKGFSFLNCEIENGVEAYELKPNHSLLLRINLATYGLMRRLIDLLTEALAITTSEEVVDQSVLFDAYNAALNDTHDYNPFDKDLSIAKVKTRLKQEALYEVK